MSYVVSSDEVVLDWFRVACAVLEPVQRGRLTCLFRTGSRSKNTTEGWVSGGICSMNRCCWGRPTDYRPICLPMVEDPSCIVCFASTKQWYVASLLFLFGRIEKNWCSDTSLVVRIALFIHPGNVNGASIETKQSASVNYHNSFFHATAIDIRYLLYC